MLIGFADALAAPEVAASLLGAGWRVLAFSRRGRRVALSHMGAVEICEVTPPELDLEACAREIAVLAAGCDATMPLDDPALLAADMGLPAEALLAGPRGERLELALDKRIQMRSAEAAGLAVPQWRELSSDPPAETDLEFPAMLKPALAAEVRGGRLVRPSPRPVADLAELRERASSLGPETPAILQQWLEGTGRGLFGIAGPEGIHHLSAHRRVRMMNPAGSGSSACVSTPVPEELIDPVEDMLGSIRWEGLFMIELLESAGRLWFMELNGRPWGSIALSRRLGFEYPAWALARALDPGAEIPPSPPERELVCRNLGRELVHLLFVLRGPGSDVGGWPTRASTVRDLLRSPGSSAWYNRDPEMKSLFWHDAWQTLAAQTWASKPHEHDQSRDPRPLRVVLRRQHDARGDRRAVPGPL